MCLEEFTESLLKVWDVEDLLDILMEGTYDIGDEWIVFDWIGV